MRCGRNRTGDLLHSAVWRRTRSLIHVAGLGLVFSFLAFVGAGLTRGARRLLPWSLRYEWRQGISNMFRPGNQTILMILALGLGTFLILTMMLVERSVISRLEGLGGEDRPDMILFDIQPSEVDGVRALLTAQGLTATDVAPMVTMRIKEIGGRTINEIRADSASALTWAHTREYRSTYRDTLATSETVVAGEFVGTHTNPDAPVPVSVEQGLTEDALTLGLGDTIVFDVQGVPVTTRLTSVWRVDWQQMRPNFSWVFPAGVLESVPQVYVLATRAGGEASAGRLQATLAAEYPSVAAISLDLILRVLDAVIGRVNTILRSMALFCIIAGILGLAKT